MSLLHRAGDRIEVPVSALAARVTPDFRVGIVTSVLAVACLVVVGALGNVHGHSLHQRVIALAGAGGFLVLAAIAIRSVGNEMHRVLAARAGEGHATVVRLLITFAGYSIAVLATLGLLAVPVQHLLLGGALTGVIVGIAAQQALGNIFAGLVLLLARPFNVGDAIRIRSGSLGGEFHGRVLGMGLTYVTVDTDSGVLSVPNSQVLDAGIGRLPDAADLPAHAGLVIATTPTAAYPPADAGSTRS
jgi:small-conductance mechanosensitive channel